MPIERISRRREASSSTSCSSRRPDGIGGGLAHGLHRFEAAPQQIGLVQQLREPWRPEVLERDAAHVVLLLECAQLSRAQWRIKPAR